MSLLGAAAIGASALSGLGARRARKDANKDMSRARDDLLGGREAINTFAGLADQFAKYGQDRLDRYTQMFSPLEDVLNDYFTNLNADEFAAQGNQAAQQAYQQAMNQVNSDLAARGLSASGIGSQMNYDLANQMAQTKAQNTMNAPHQVAQMQQGWLQGYGAPQMNQAFNQYGAGVGMQGNVANMYNSNANALANLGIKNAGFNRDYAKMGWQGMGDAANAAGYFFGR
jgi:hypothetical protein